jgi:hypothetical protein
MKWHPEDIGTHCPVREATPMDGFHVDVENHGDERRNPLDEK